jgi:Holliday junction resolvasome RuvABC DNA-binding subunit
MRTATRFSIMVALLKFCLNQHQALRGQQPTTRKEIEMSNFSEAEKKEVQILIRLGDSEQLAIDTVKNAKEKEDSKSAYQFAYES